jgi:hypothetical protein
VAAERLGASKAGGRQPEQQVGHAVAEIAANEGIGIDGSAGAVEAGRVGHGEYPPGARKRLAFSLIDGSLLP